MVQLGISCSHNTASLPPVAQSIGALPVCGAGDSGSSLSATSALREILALRLPTIPCDEEEEEEEEEIASPFQAASVTVKESLNCETASVARRWSSNRIATPHRASDTPPYRGRSGAVVRLPASHLCEPSSIPCSVSPGFSRVGTVPDDASGQRALSGISRFPPPLHFGTTPYSPNFTLIGSQDLDVGVTSTTNASVSDCHVNSSEYRWSKGQEYTKSDESHILVSGELFKQVPQPSRKARARETETPRGNPADIGNVCQDSQRTYRNQLTTYDVSADVGIDQSQTRSAETSRNQISHKEGAQTTGYRCVQVRTINILHVQHSSIMDTGTEPACVLVSPVLLPRFLTSDAQLQLTLNIEVLRADEGNAGIKRRVKREIPEKTICSTIPTCESAGATPPGIEPSSPRWENSSLTTTQQPPHEARCPSVHGSRTPSGTESSVVAVVNWSTYLVFSSFQICVFPIRIQASSGCIYVLKEHMLRTMCELYPERFTHV
ncbi:hypothetical protein PR048_022964 [Dryococelus australis]|uniref:Uncharacterized protein n=1 Tax=Dryococelus australis TaxID=614101 RepID=A0ABQ9GSR8_9NEOP|nr:hypothetical protein PR048_022964 [Dryococelus australis]